MVLCVRPPPRQCRQRRHVFGLYVCLSVRPSVRPYQRSPFSFHIYITHYAIPHFTNSLVVDVDVEREFTGAGQSLYVRLRLV